MLSDLRLAFRALDKSRAFAAIAIITLATGIGGTTAMFSALRALVVVPFQYPNPDQLVMVWSGDYWPLSSADFKDLHEKSTSFADFGCYTPRTANVGSEKPEAVSSVVCTSGVLRAFGVRPKLGRWLEPADDEKGAAPVAVISHALWQKSFGGDPGLIGRAVRIDENNVTIVGILPASFEFSGPWVRMDTIDVFLPLSLKDDTTRHNHWLCGIARLRAGVSVGAADAEIKALGAQLSKQYPDTNTNKKFLVGSLHYFMTRDLSSRVWMLFGAVSLVLLVACANVASMLLARNAQRQGEFSLRVALGATRGAIARLALAESGVLAIGGAGVGLAFALGGMHLLRAIEPIGEARRAAIAFDTPTLFFALAATLLVSLLAGLPPAWAAIRTSTAAIVRDGGRSAAGSRARHRLLRGLIIAQVTVAFVLANIAALFSSSYLKLLAENNALASENVLSGALNLNGARYDKSEDRARFWKQLAERLELLPGVSAVGLTSKLPLEGGSNTNALVNDEVYDPAQQRLLVERSSVTPGYLGAMGLTIVKGRNLQPLDSEGEITGVVVNRKMVEKAWPNKDPLGELIRGNNPGKPWYQSRVVGVVEDVRQWGAESEAQPEMYGLPRDIWGARAYVIVRSPLPASQLTPLVRREIAALDGELALTNVRTMNDVVHDATKSSRAVAGMVNVFMVTALGLVAVGIYGTLSYHVLQRTREIGVRMAMGAVYRDIFHLVLGQASIWVGLGISIGVVGTLALSSVLHATVYGMGRLPVLPLLLAAGAVGLAALVACWAPAHHAARMNPLVALRAD